MKILLFGLGNYYNKYSKWINLEDVVGLIDNDKRKIGTIIDGYRVISPYEVNQVEYDIIVLMSIHEKEMREQLVTLGVDEYRIIKYSEYISSINMSQADISFFCLPDFLTKLFSNHGKGDSLLLLAHSLEINGATIALISMAYVLKNNGYSLMLGTAFDGALKNNVIKMGIPVVVDPKLIVCSYHEISWVHPFDQIICNTINFATFLIERRKDVSYIWWLHDPEIFVDSLDTSVFKSIDMDGLKVISAGILADDAIRKYRPDIKIYRFLYGVPDIKKVRYEKKNLDKHIKMTTIGYIQHHKGQDVLADAILRLSREEQSLIDFVMVGNIDSEYAERVHEKLVRSNCRLKFISSLNRDAVEKLLEKTDVYICPSRLDTMPVTVAESMRSCVPSIVSDGTGMTEFVEDTVNGFVFSNEDSDMLSEKIRWCIQNKDALPAIGKRARGIYEKYFSMDVFEENLMKIVKDAF